MPKNHTADAIFAEYENVVEEWKLNSKVIIFNLWSTQLVHLAVHWLSNIIESDLTSSGYSSCERQHEQYDSCL